MKLHAYLEQRLEALGYAPKLEFELSDGSTVELAHPWLWSKETQDAYDGAVPARSKGKTVEPVNVRRARAALGDDQYRRFAADGGNENHVVLAIDLMQRREETAASQGSAGPKGS